MMSHGQDPIFHSKYCYNHHLVKGQAVDVHNISIKRSPTRVFLSYIGTVVFLINTLYSLVIKELCMSSIWSIFLGVAFAKFLQYNPVKKEYVVIISELGIQLEAHYWSGKVDHRFVPISAILKPVLNECVTPFTCYWSLALMIRDKDGLLMVFQKMQPPLKMLIPVWRALCSAADHKATVEAAMNICVKTLIDVLQGHKILHLSFMIRIPSAVASKLILFLNIYK